MNNRKGITPIIIVLTILVLLVGGFLTYQYLWISKEKVEVPDNWKVYVNEKYQYEIKYSPDLEIDTKEKFESYGTTIEMTPMISWTFSVEETLDVAKFIIIEVRDNFEKKSLLSTLDYDPTFCKIEKEQDTFAKISCEEIESGGAFKTIGSVYLKNDRVYIITLMIMLPEDLMGIDFSSEINTYNLMLSTFKFLEGEVIVPPQISYEDMVAMRSMDNIGVIARGLYLVNDSYLGLDKNQDVLKAQKQIQDRIGTWPRIVISNNAYCADMTLSDGKTKYCIDSEREEGQNLSCSDTKFTCTNY